MAQLEEDAIQLSVVRLVERAKTGDSGAFEGLYTLYFAELCGYLFGLVRNPEDARDVAQQTFLQVMACWLMAKSKTMLSSLAFVHPEQEN